MEVGVWGVGRIKHVVAFEPRGKGSLTYNQKVYLTYYFFFQVFFFFDDVFIHHPLDSTIVRLHSLMLSREVSLFLITWNHTTDSHINKSNNQNGVVKKTKKTNPVNPEWSHFSSVYALVHFSNLTRLQEKTMQNRCS